VVSTFPSTQASVQMQRQAGRSLCFSRPPLETRNTHILRYNAVQTAIDLIHVSRSPFVRKCRQAVLTLHPEKLILNVLCVRMP